MKIASILMTASCVSIFDGIGDVNVTFTKAE